MRFFFQSAFKVNSEIPKPIFPFHLGKPQKPAEAVTGGLKNVASKFLGVVELDPTTGDLHVRGGGSLQKDLDVASHVLEEGAVETAAIIEKGVLNPFTKLTKGLGAVLKGDLMILHNKLKFMLIFGTRWRYRVP